MVVQMDMIEAVQKAKKYINEIFADENIDHLGVEEVVFDNDNKEETWKITIGFFRPWHQREGLAAALSQFRWNKREFKVVKIDNRTGRIISMTHRTLTTSD